VTGAVNCSVTGTLAPAFKAEPLAALVETAVTASLTAALVVSIAPALPGASSLSVVVTL
jgi:hypothetical protein